MKASKLLLTGLTLLIATLWLTTALPDRALGDAPDLGIVPVDETYLGLSYGEWSAKGWQWALSLPVDRHPLFDTADCSTGQSGRVWFLGGTFLAGEISPGVILGQATRNCTVPSRRALFFPIVNAECSTLEGNGTTDAELRACAKSFTDLTVKYTLDCTIDGVHVNSTLAISCRCRQLIEQDVPILWTQ